MMNKSSASLTSVGIFIVLKMLWQFMQQIILGCAEFYVKLSSDLSPE